MIVGLWVVKRKGGMKFGIMAPPSHNEGKKK
jgi:hypothetical protein